MAAIYNAETGDCLTEGLQGCSQSDQAVNAARRIAAGRDEPVHLVDDDGDWIIHPDGTATPHTPG